MVSGGRLSGGVREDKSKENISVSIESGRGSFKAREREEESVDASCLNFV